MLPIAVARGGCSRCYPCIRSCPVGAIRIASVQATVIEDRCIACGQCATACGKGVVEIEDGLPRVETMLARRRPAAALLSFATTAVLWEIEPPGVPAVLRRLGFSAVFDADAGFELVADAYRTRIERAPDKTHMTTYCPAIAYLVEQHFPELVASLLPVLSAPFALARSLKRLPAHAETDFVYVSPCLPPREELRRTTGGGALAAVLTYTELDRLLTARGVSPWELQVAAAPDRLGRDGTSGLPAGPSPATTANLPGGVLALVDRPPASAPAAPLPPGERRAITGLKAAMSALERVRAGAWRPQLLDLAACHGCVAGHLMPAGYDPLAAERQIPAWAEAARADTGETSRAPLPAAPLHRRWHNRGVRAPEPTEAEVVAILQEIGFTSPADALDCGACGYATCRELAVAIHQGRGEVGQCLPLAVERLERSRQEIEKSYQVMQREFDSHFGIDFIVGRSPQMRDVHSLVMKVAPTPTTVLIRGESGTGKELIARAIHQNSPVKDRPLVTLNCTAIPEGLLESELFGHVKGAFTGAVASKLGVFEAADGGTLFLDEIGDISPGLQAKLLRVLQTGEIKRVGEATSRTVRVRLIAATNRDLEADIRAGRFREDLYYRLNIVEIELPPLRARRGDIALLAEHFLKRARAKLNKNVTGISRETLAMLRAYAWPGNIRELENVIERAVVFAQAGRIEADHLPENVRAATLPGGTLPPPRLAAALVEVDAGAVPEAGSLIASKRRLLDRFERAQLLAYLSRAGGNISRAARLADVPRRTFHRLLAKHGLTRADYVPKVRT